VGCHLLGDLQLAAILQISRDAGGAKGVAAYLGLDASLGSAARRRRSYAEATRRTAAGITVQLARATTRGAEEWPFPVLVGYAVAAMYSSRSHFDALKGIYVRKHTDLTWSSGADLRLQYGASSDRMRHRNALVSIARQRHLDRRSSYCPDGHARYAYWVDICVLIAASRDIAFTVNHAL
jgi:hypothetical protein